MLYNNYKLNKYNNNIINLNGEKYDSKKEARRHQELLLLQRAGKIKDLQRQVKFVLIPSQRIDGKVVEQECSYKADFVYVDSENGQTVVEDTKGFKTKEYIIKRKLMLHKYGIKIIET